MSRARIFRYFKTSPEIIHLAVMMYVRYPLSLRNVEDLLHERGIDITHETVRFNNRAENSHQPFRRRERAMLRFRRMRSLQKFAAVHGSVHNQFASRTFGSIRNATSHRDQHSGKTRRRTRRVASTLRGLIHAGVGDFPRLCWFV